MSTSVPRGTSRLSVRVPATLKDDVQRTVANLQARGLRTSETELVQMLVADGLRASSEDLDARLRAWRSAPTGAPS